MKGILSIIDKHYKLILSEKTKEEAYSRKLQIALSDWKSKFGSNGDINFEEKNTKVDREPDGEYSVQVSKHSKKRKAVNIKSIAIR